MKNKFLSQCSFLILMIVASAFSLARLFPLSVLFSAIIIAFYTVKHGPIFTLSGLVPLFAVGCMAGGTSMGIFLCLHSLSAFCVGYFMHKNGKFSSMLICATIIEVTILTVFTLHLCSIQQVKPIDLLFGASFDQFIETFSYAGQVETTLLSDLRSATQYMLQMLQTMLPVLYLTLSAAFVYIIFGTTRFLLKRKGHTIDSMPYFHELWLPGSISGIFVILFILSMLTASPILMNVASFMFMVYVVCGLSLAYYLLRSKRIPKGVCALITVAILLIASMVGGLCTSILCCMGMSNGTRSARK